MAKTKIREITIRDSKGTFTIFKKRKLSKKDYDFSGLKALRRLLSNERARILDTIKVHKPKSIYELAKILNRSFKSVSEDIQLLDKFGFIDLIEEKTKNRKRHKPEVAVDKVTIHIEI